MSYYGDSQWPAGTQPAGAWDHQTPPTRSGLPPNNASTDPTRTYIDKPDPGASSAIPREETSAFWYQFEEVERAIENLVKSGKMFGVPGARREFQQPFPPGPARSRPNFDPRNSGGPQRPHSVEFDGRPGHPSSNLQNFYASQRHQSSRGSNEAEQMMQHKRRMAAQRERELRNYHQEQQFNRTAFADLNVGAAGGPGTGPGPATAAAASINSANPVRPDRNLSPGNLSEEARRELIARQRSALYGEGPFADTGGYIDETGAPRQGLPATHHGGSASLRGPSPLAYEYSRNAPAHPDVGAQSSADPASGGAQQPSRTSSNASPQSNPGPKGPLEQTTRTSNSSPGGGSPQNAKPPAGKTVAPIGTRPSGPSSNQGPAKQSASSPLTHGFSAPGANEAAGNSTSTGPVNTSSTTTSGEGSTPLGNWGQRGGPWGPKTQTSVWG